jgi:hypothetical protein
MSRSHDEERFPYALQGIADALRHERPALTPIALDRLKLKAMNRARQSAPRRDERHFIRSRLTTLLTVGFLILGTCGALAALGGDDLSLGGEHAGSAAFEQFRPPTHDSSSGDDEPRDDRSGRETTKMIRAATKARSRAIVDIRPTRCPFATGPRVRATPDARVRTRDARGHPGHQLGRCLWAL